MAAANRDIALTRPEMQKRMRERAAVIKARQTPWVLSIQGNSGLERWLALANGRSDPSACS
jgi:hypothetical protein